MNRFILDQCADDCDFAENCTKEGRCEIWRCPEDCKNKDDELVIPTFLAGTAAVITTDYNLILEHPNSVSVPNPGVIVVLTRLNRDDQIERAIVEFKNKYPRWYETNWSGLYVEIEDRTQRVVFINKLINGDVHTGGRTIDLDAAGFAEQLAAAVADLSQGNPARLSPT